MGTVLYIKANPKNDQASRTFRISESFVQAYKESHPQDQVVMLDLYKEGIHFLTPEDITSVFGPKNEESPKHPVLKYAYQFAAADKYIIAAPMWNLGIPAVLKAYIDYITVTGITFKYTEQGAVGLLQGKKAVHIMATGGQYTEGPFSAYEMANRYLKTIFGFLGITDITTLIAEKLDIVGVDSEGIVSTAQNEAQKAAKAF